MRPFLAMIMPVVGSSERPDQTLPSVPALPDQELPPAGSPGSPTHPIVPEGGVPTHPIAGGASVYIVVPGYGVVGPVHLPQKPQPK